MLQYILNATAIWLISLILFDVFLRGQSFHNYNRFFLLFTFLLGALFPLVQWQDAGRPLPATIERPLERVITAKQTVVSVSDQPSAGWQQWLLIAYFAGAAVAVILLLIEVSKLIAYYRSGRRQKQGNWTIIETGLAHAPFSFLHTLFVGSIAQYSDDEWSMILAHEHRHTALRHFADLMLIQLGRVVFWFHPLVYVYNSRLLLVHEYQADSASAAWSQAYGRFLVEQALLAAAPAVSHSFNRSPIKNRIIMLSRRSSAASKTRMLVFIPLAIVCTLCFSRNSFSQKFERKGNVVTYHGNQIELSVVQPDTQIVVDPVTAEQRVVIINHDPKPIKMNGVPIVEMPDKEPYYKGDGKSLRAYMLKGMKKELSKLKDGMYTININQILVDERGRIVYFEYEDLRRSKMWDEIPANVKNQRPSAGPVSGDKNLMVNIGGKDVTVRKNTNPAFYEDLSPATRQEIYNKICELMDKAPAFIPGMVNGKPVLSFYSDLTFWNAIKIQGHKLYDSDREGKYVPVQ